MINEKLKEFIERNKEILKEYKETLELSDFPDDIRAFPIEYQEFIEKWEKKVDEINQIKDVNKKSSVLLKSLVEELKEKVKLYDYLDEIYNELETYRLSNKNNSLSGYWDYFISIAIMGLEFNRPPLQEYFYTEKERIKFPAKELEKILNPVYIEKTITSDLVREIRQEIRNSLIIEKAELEKLKSQNTNEIVKKYEELAKKEDELIKRLKGEKVHLFYFEHNLKAYVIDDLVLIQDLIRSYISQQINVKEDYIYPFFNKAFVKNNNIENIEREVFFNGATEKDIKLKSFYDEAVYDIIGIILSKFQLEAEQKRKEQKEKEKRAEKFYKSYNKEKTQLPIPYFISRNNPFLLVSEKIKRNEEFKINSYWGQLILEATKDNIEIFNTSDIRNLLSVYALEWAYIEHLRKEKLSDEDILKVLVIDGVIIPLPVIAETRDIEKRKKNYEKIIESIDKAQKIQVKGKLSIDVKGEALEIKERFSLISGYTEITYKNKKALHIRLYPWVAEWLIAKKGKYHNKKLINNIPDNLLPLYFTIDNLRLNPSIKEKTISKKILLENSRLAYTKTGQERPDKAFAYLKEKLNQLKRGIKIYKNLNIKIIKDWEEVEMYNGEEGIKLYFD